MTDTSSSSCKIVIKAANQKYEDFNVDAPELEWTIKQLKQHLSENYPSNPVSRDGSAAARWFLEIPSLS